MAHPPVLDVPSNIYKPKNPYMAPIVSRKRLTAPDSQNDVEHIVLDISGSDFQYLDGQSIGVLPPGTDANGKPQKLRLYSIASPHVGDDGNGKTVSICVKRAVNPPHPPGICSGYLCDSAIGDKVSITGPVGKTFLLPSASNANLIMIATGTGIAPFRAFLKTRYTERVTETGESWVFFGCQTGKDLLYADEYETYKTQPGFNLITAVSREQQNKDGGRMYVQHRLEEYAEQVFNLLKSTNTYIYMCGLRGMEPGVKEGLQKAAESQGIDFNDFFTNLKQEGRWHVEVY